MQNGLWGEEERSGEMNIAPGQEFNIKVNIYILHT